MKDLLYDIHDELDYQNHSFRISQNFSFRFLRYIFEPRNINRSKIQFHCYIIRIAEMNYRIPMKILYWMITYLLKILRWFSTGLIHSLYGLENQTEKVIDMNDFQKKYRFLLTDQYFRILALVLDNTGFAWNKISFHGIEVSKYHRNSRCWIIHPLTLSLSWIFLSCEYCKFLKFLCGIISWTLCAKAFPRS